MKRGSKIRSTGQKGARSDRDWGVDSATYFSEVGKGKRRRRLARNMVDPNEDLDY